MVTLVSTEVSIYIHTYTEWHANRETGIGPKVTQSVLTAALLFAFKDVLYEQTVRLRMAGAARRRVAA